MAIKIPIFSDYDNKGVRDAEGALKRSAPKLAT